MDTDTDLDRALAFYQPPPESWYSGIHKKIEATGQWIWETIQGDFNDNQSTGQVVTGTVISMIPLVDQICDVRDLVANCMKIKEGNDKNRYHLGMGGNDPHSGWSYSSCGFPD